MDETGMISAFGGDPQTVIDQAAQSAIDYAASLPPTSQTDFNSVASPGNVTGVLGGIAQVIQAGAGAITSYQTNTAAASAAALQAQQTLATNQKLAQFQNATVLAQAQAAYNKAAGAVSSNPGTLVIVLGVAGLILAAVQLRKKG